MPSTLFGDVMLSMLASLRTLPTLAEMGAFADVKIRQLAGRGKEPPFGFTDVVDAWSTADVSPDVDTLIAATGLSGRQVERLANRIYGAPPKLLARKFRALRGCRPDRGGRGLANALRRAVLRSEPRDPRVQALHRPDAHPASCKAARRSRG